VIFEKPEDKGISSLDADDLNMLLASTRSGGDNYLSLSKNNKEQAYLDFDGDFLANSFNVSVRGGTKLDDTIDFSQNFSGSSEESSTPDESSGTASKDDSPTDSSPHSSSQTSSSPGTASPDSATIGAAAASQRNSGDLRHNSQLMKHFRCKEKV
jgi:hypothetical protein